MGHPLCGGVYRNCHTRGIGEQQTKGSTCCTMLAQGESAVNWQPSMLIRYVN